MTSTRLAGRSGVGGGRSFLACVDDLAAYPLTGEADLAHDVHLLLAVFKRGEHLGHQLVMRCFGGFHAALVRGGETAKSLLAVFVHVPIFAHGVRHQGMAVSHGLSIAKHGGH